MRPILRLGKSASVLAFLFAVIVGIAQSTPAMAVGFDVYVGYADGLRGTGFFPDPWDGSPGVTFRGVNDSAMDAGAILIRNTSGAALTIHDVMVTINGSGPIQPNWSLPVTLASNAMLILTETAHYNFDTSDTNPISPVGVAVTDCSVTCPIVSVDTGSGFIAFKDSTHTLDTLGYDFAALGLNESFNWRLIGSCAGPGCGGGVGAVPLPATLPLLGIGLGMLGFSGVRRQKKHGRAS